jgi:hypothetical protein
MAGNSCPRLVWILIRLARNWAISKNRYERHPRRTDTLGPGDDKTSGDSPAMTRCYRQRCGPTTRSTTCTSGIHYLSCPSGVRQVPTQGVDPHDNPSDRR